MKSDKSRESWSLLCTSKMGISFGIGIRLFRHSSVRVYFSFCISSFSLLPAPCTATNFLHSSILITLVKEFWRVGSFGFSRAHFWPWMNIVYRIYISLCTLYINFRINNSSVTYCHLWKNWINVYVIHRGWFYLPWSYFFFF